jgi:hypothetical protein
MVKSWLTHHTQVITRCTSESLPDPHCQAAAKTLEALQRVSEALGALLESCHQLGHRIVPVAPGLGKGSGWKLSVVDCVWTQDSCQGPYQTVSSASEVCLSIHVHGRSPSGIFLWRQVRLVSAICCHIKRNIPQ